MQAHDPLSIPLFQIFTVCACLAMIIHAASGYRRGKRSLRELIAWALLWGAVGLLGIHPTLADTLSKFMGIKSGASALIFFALIVLFYVTFRCVLAIEQLEERLTELTRSLAMKDFNGNDSQAK